MRFDRRTALATVVALFALAPTYAADNKTVPYEWEPKRVTSPESVEELKALQFKVKAVFDQVTPTTVGLLLGNDPNSRGLSCGSGVIVSPDGLVLTAAHVIGKPRQPVVFVLPDGKKVNGISLGMNPRNDSGMARITDKPPKGYPGAQGEQWPFSKPGTSVDLKKGQWIISLGHPGGPKPERAPPVRVGRYVKLDKAGRFQRNDLLNTDATLVGGDSGGPLFDLNGQVVGIHSEIGETIEENRHVPLEKYTDEWERMLRGDIIYKTAGERERNTKVGLNVYFDKETADAARVEEVADGGAADEAGILAGDVIVKFDDKPVKSAEDLRLMLPSYRVGERVKVEVDRDGQTFTVEMKLNQKPKE